MTHTTSNIERPWLRRYTKVLVLATLALIFLGGQVKSHEAGLAVPDWPTTFGENMFVYPLHKWVGNIFHEHLHRVVAASVGFLTIVLAAWMAFVERRPWVRWLGCVALVMVIAQGLLGGLTVRLLLPAWVSTSHAVLAQSFFLFMIFVAYTQSRERRERVNATADTGSWRLAWPAIVVVGLVYLQLIVGALMRHTESGLALPDFPTMAGQLMPVFTEESREWVNAWRAEHSFETGAVLGDVTLGQLWIHFAHRAGAVLILFATVHALWHAARHADAAPRIWRSTLILAGLVAVQIGLGITTVLTAKTPLITSLHVATGAATMGWTFLLALRAMPLQVETARNRVPHAPSPAPVASAEIRKANV